MRLKIAKKAKRNADLIRENLIISPLSQSMVGLSRALKVFEDEKLDLVHIESRKVKGTKGEV